jgi:hypothetical protein
MIKSKIKIPSMATPIKVPMRGVTVVEDEAAFKGASVS